MPDAEVQPEHGSFEYFAKIICRQNTGRHMLDSGDFYGRQYDRPVAQKSDPALKITPEAGYIERCRMSDEQWQRGDAHAPHSNEEQRFFGSDDYQPGDTCHAMSSISLPHFLEAMLSSSAEVKKLQDMFYKWANLKRNERESWEENLESFFKRLKAHGFAVKEKDGGYTYNSENDFDQDFVYQIIELTDNSGYSEDVIIIRSHNGCDARGGFSSPFFFVWASSYASDYFWDWRIEWSFEFDAYEIDAEAWQKNQISLADIDQSVNEWIERDNHGSQYFSASEITDYQISEGETRYKDYALRFVYVDENTAQAQVELPWRKGTWVDIYPYSPVEGY